MRRCMSAARQSQVRTGAGRAYGCSAATEPGSRSTQRSSLRPRTRTSESRRNPPPFPSASRAEQYGGGRKQRLMKQANAKVLIADDEVAITAGLSAILSDEGYTVEVAQ